MTPVWMLKLGAVAITLTASAGFWHYVTGHIYPDRAPLKPAVARTVVDTPSPAETGWDLSGGGMPTPTPPPVVKTVVVVHGPQQQVQNGAALGASWVANRTGQRPVQATRVS